MRSLILVLAALLLVITNAQAVVITTMGAGSSVTDIDRMATFDDISGSLLGYTEDGLLVSVDDTHCCYSGVHYGSGGNNSFVTISTTDGADFFGLELDLGTGFVSGLHDVVWKTSRDGITTGSGVLHDIFTSTGVVSGLTVLGWSDVDLFDTLFIGAAPNYYDYDVFGKFQAIALDNVKVDFGASVSVPEPASIALLGIGLVGIGFARKK